jgi:hypothetical protein
VVRSGEADGAAGCELGVRLLSDPRRNRALLSIEEAVVLDDGG